MTEQGSPPHDWVQWISAANEQGLNILRGLTAVAGPGAEAGNAAPVFVEAWQRALNDGAEAPDPAATAQRFNRLMEEALAQGRSGTDAFVAMIETAATALHQLRAWQSLSSSSETGELFATFFRLPLVGPAWSDRSKAEETRDGLRRYARALTDYQGELTRAVEAALQAFNDALRSRQAAGTFPASFSRLHELWIEIAEPAYETVLASDAFAGAFAEFHNAATALTALVQRELAPVLTALNLPSREELADVEQRLQTLRRDQDRTAALEAEVEALRSELAALRAELRQAHGADGQPD